MQKVSKHYYFRSEESGFSEFIDSVAPHEEEVQKLLRVRNRHKQRRKKGKEGAKQCEEKNNRRPSEVITKVKEGGFRKGSKIDLMDLSNSTDTKVSRVGHSVSKDMGGVDERDECIEVGEEVSQKISPSINSGVRHIGE